MSRSTVYEKSMEKNMIVRGTIFLRSTRVGNSLLNLAHHPCCHKRRNADSREGWVR